jgi:hypothetical protein
MYVPGYAYLDHFTSMKGDKLYLSNSRVMDILYEPLVKSPKTYFLGEFKFKFQTPPHMPSEVLPVIVIVVLSVV